MKRLLETSVATAAVLVLASCSSTAEPPKATPAPTSTATSAAPTSVSWPVPSPPTSTPPPAPITPPNPASADATNPDSTSQVVLALMYEIDTTRDKSFADGLRRAEPLLSPEYAAEVRNTPDAEPGAEWQEWTQHQAYTKVQTEVSPEDRPLDTATTAHRAFQLTINPIGRDGWTGPPTVKIALVTLVKATGGWVVKQINYS